MVEELDKIEIRQEFPIWKKWLKPITEKDFKPGIYSYIALPKQVDSDFFRTPYGNVVRDIHDKDWKLPENWKEIVLNEMEDTLKKNRAFKLFLDICVRCGVCADKCHYYLGTGDPKNMPVMRAELIRSVYRYYFTTSGKVFKEWAGARPLTEDVIKEWYYYLYQCSLCRRCALFCPYGIDTAEIVWWARRVLSKIGLNQRFMCTSIEASARTGNHLGLYPGGMAGALEMACDEISEITGLDVHAYVNKKGADILFVPPSGDYFATPHWFTLMGYIMLFYELEQRYGLIITFSTYAGEGGNFGTFHSYEAAQLLNSKIYKEAERLGVKWILGGECGHMWRDKHQYINTMNNPPKHPEWEDPVNPITGTRFKHVTAEHGWIHVLEFTADLIAHRKIKIDPSRNDHWKVTYHDPCNLARAVGIIEEPRYILRNVCNYFYEMPEHTIREKTYCCAAGGVYLGDEMMELRIRGCMPRMMALRHVVRKYGVNLLVTPCAIDRAQFPHMIEYWKIPAEVAGVHELVGNALVMTGEKEREVDLRGNPLRREE